MVGEPVRWSDEAQEVISGDITTAAAYLTPAGGAVVTAVATFGIADCGGGMVGFTTSLGFPKSSSGSSATRRDGFPVVVPVHLAGHDGKGLRLVAAPGPLPPGAAVQACSPTPTGHSWSG